VAQISPLNESERSRIKHFLEYPDWQSLAYSIQLGFPASSQPMYLLEGAFDRITNAALESVRKDLCELESIETQLGTARTRLPAEQLGNLKVNMKELPMLRRELVWWALVLANDLGVGPNPFSAMEILGGAGGRNATVIS
jgi:hypothetical protein